MADDNRTHETEVVKAGVIVMNAVMREMDIARLHVQGEISKEESNKLTNEHLEQVGNEHGHLAGMLIAAGMMKLLTEVRDLVPPMMAALEVHRVLSDREKGDS